MALLVAMPFYKRDNSDDIWIHAGDHRLIHVNSLLAGLVLCVLPLTWYLLRCHDQKIRRARVSEHRCPACGYDLRGHARGERCPECGAVAG